MPASSPAPGSGRVDVRKDEVLSWIAYWIVFGLILLVPVGLGVGARYAAYVNGNVEDLSGGLMVFGALGVVLLVPILGLVAIGPRHLAQQGVKVGGRGIGLVRERRACRTGSAWRARRCGSNRTGPGTASSSARSAPSAPTSSPAADPPVGSVDGGGQARRGQEFGQEPDFGVGALPPRAAQRRGRPRGLDEGQAEHVTEGLGDRAAPGLRIGQDEEVRPVAGDHRLADPARGRAPAPVADLTAGTEPFERPVQAAVLDGLGGPPGPGSAAGGARFGLLRGAVVHGVRPGIRREGCPGAPARYGAGRPPCA